MRWAALWHLVPLIIAVVDASSTYNHIRHTYASLQCRVNDPLSCDQSKSEVCVFINGQYRCECPVGVHRLQDGRCVLVDECARPSLNGCHRDAHCIDLPDGYTCRCNDGFADVSPDKVNKPGRMCQKTANECGNKDTYGVDCDEKAACVDTPEGFQCVCQPGFVDVSASISKLPGRKCVEQVNECTNGQADCSPNADCFDRADGYECKCRPGYVDASPSVDKYPGRVCNKPKSPEYYGQPSKHNECSSASQCGANEECRFNAAGEMVCQCRRGSVQQSNGVCKVFSQCEHSNECDRNAFCSNTYDGPKCQCKDGFVDVSPDPVRLPGRKCQQVRNECADGSHDCSPNANCHDTQTGYICTCKSGCIDVSSRYNQPPGRKCSEAANQCTDKSLNSCDVNADCVQLPDGYTCKCFAGYADVSSNANLPPGRVCTLSTACPAQPTDLVFLIDGSGSIGSYVFQTEVLRFLAEFTELFDIAPEKTRVSVVQYSDQIRHEFGLDEHKDRKSLQDAIHNIEYLTGLTRTGAAIEHVANEAFSERRGARPVGQVSRVAIVITDGRSQDNVTRPADNARRQDIQLFAVGVTNHVLDAELEEISGSKDRTFHVSGFEDLNTRLRSAIQRVACPHQSNDVGDTYNKGPCDPANHNGCDRSLNQVCMSKDGKLVCSCPPGFDIHPVTKVCGGDVCNPEIPTSCPDPEICERTPFGNWRCTCPADLGWRDRLTGVCKIGEKPLETSPSTDECRPEMAKSCPPNAKCTKGAGGEFICKCDEGFTRNSRTNKCDAAGTCDPRDADSCDARKQEKCLPNPSGGFSCQCDRHHNRHPVTDICLINECAAGIHDCDVNAVCHDTDDSYICACKEGYIDKSPEASRKPGRICSMQRNECLDGTHNCSMNAECFDLADGFLCRCRDGFIDLSPNNKAFGGVECRALVDECSIPGGSNCHEHAICIDTRDSYKCQCKEGYVDHDELRNPGRDCRKMNQLCESGNNDCDKNARCVEKGANDYECVCNAGFIDKSPLPNKAGRKCVEPICADPSKHECHPAAVCEETDEGGYTCKCRDGYADVGGEPGRECKELVNECLDASLNTCDAAASCVDLEDGYTCKCPLGSRDESPDVATHPGRNCKALVNECNIPHLNNCSHFATCTDLDDGYECKCKPDYHDQNPAQPGTQCKFIINECLAENLNDCSVNAECIDQIDGYDCKCRHPHMDEMPSRPGRVCRFNECLNKADNDCDANADCIDTDDSYTCQCREGFFDEITDPKKPGRVCVGLSIEPQQQAEPQRTTSNPNEIPCGGGVCHLDLGEVCVGGASCSCRPGESRDNEHSKCVPVKSVPLVVRVMEYDGEPIQYSTDYSKPDSQRHVEIEESVKKAIGKLVGKTDVAPRYVTTDVNYITNPKVQNSDWDHGVLVNSTVQLAGDAPVDKCRLFEQIAQVVEEMGGRVDRIRLSDDSELDPCRKAQDDEMKKGVPCGSTFCQPELGEECVAGKICGCPKGQKRKDANSACRVVESWNLPLHVVRDGEEMIAYSPSLANPLNDQYKDLVTRFEKGVAASYDKTPLKSGFVTAEVNEIENPETRHKNLDTGILYNFTSHFVKGSVAEPSTVFTDLIDYIQKKNKNEVGHSKLYISQDQMNPFSSCYRSDCHPDAVCKEVGKGYTCTCPDGFRDLMPSNPGHECLAYRGVNECERPELNECSPHARCIDLDYLYKCECVKPYVNSAPADALPGSVCSIDYCSDVNYCPLNSTCVNVDEEARCDCRPGFVDIRESDRLSDAGLGDTICLRSSDVDECALGLHNCSAAAICIDKKNGFECQCQEGYEDGNPSQPGRVCAASLCGLCNGHGDCIHDALSSNVTCACLDGYTGQFCEQAPSNAGLILMTILALLFLLLTLLCCLYMCARCRCFGARGVSEGSASGQEILGSDYYTIPRAKLARPMYSDDFGDDNAGALAAYLDDGASISSGGSLEEIERRVTTDVTTREVRTTTVRDEDGNIISQTVSHSGGEGGAARMSAETDTEQYGIVTSDHVRAAESSAYDNHAAGYDSEGSEEDAGHATYDRTTRHNMSHDFEPGADPRTGVERSKREVVTTTRAEEVNYF